MSPASIQLLVEFWSWVSAILALLSLGILLPSTLGTLLGSLPLARSRGDWRLVWPFIGLSALFVGIGAAMLWFGGRGGPATDFWGVLCAQVGVMVFLGVLIGVTRLSFRRRREDAESIDALQRIPSDIAGATVGLQPGPRRFLNAFEAEYYVADWMRCLGAQESLVTPARRDGGVDVRAAYYVAQVKHRPTDIVPVDDVRALAGVASLEQRTPLFFTSGRYSADARAFAVQAGMALFVFRPTEGRLIAVNPLAQRLRNEGLRSSELVSH